MRVGIWLPFVASEVIVDLGYKIRNITSAIGF